ncbi:MAG: cupredoxin domain-containing protein [Candidatus Limnocylindrales bacterium]
MKTAFAAFFLLLALALGACGGSGTTAAPTSGSASTTPNESMASSSAPSAAAEGTAITVNDFTLDPLDVAVAGPVSLAVTNAGLTVHNVAIRDDAGKVLGTTADLREGEAETLTVDLPAGTYVLFCSLAGHESLGIKGTLTVTE